MSAKPADAVVRHERVLDHDALAAGAAQTEHEPVVDDLVVALRQHDVADVGDRRAAARRPEEDAEQHPVGIVDAAAENAHLPEMRKPPFAGVAFPIGAKLDALSVFFAQYSFWNSSGHSATSRSWMVITAQTQAAEPSPRASS